MILRALDRWRGSMIDLFKPVVPESQLNVGFATVARQEHFAPARAMVNDVYETFEDVDGHFLKEFQTHGFDARIWELYLHAVFREMQFDVKKLERPDFRLRRGGRDAYVEAVIAGSDRNALAAPPEPTRSSDIPAYFKDLSENFVPIRIGSPLSSKLDKRYWKDPEVARWPLCFAIEAFFDDNALFFSAATLGRFLYGIDPKPVLDRDGKLLGITTQRMKEHRSGQKSVPSGFFFRPDADRLSAVLFSNSGTITKFNRMGWLAGYRPRQPALMIRYGFAWDRDPQAALPKKFVYEVGDPRFPEDWKQGLDIFHNPTALEPFPKNWFYGLVQHALHEDGYEYAWGGPEFHPFASRTHVYLESEDVGD